MTPPLLPPEIQHAILTQRRHLMRGDRFDVLRQKLQGSLLFPISEEALILFPTRASITIRGSRVHLWEVGPILRQTTTLPNGTGSFTRTPGGSTHWSWTGTTEKSVA